MLLGAATALVIVDMQVDFADPRGSLYVHGGDELVAPINDLVVEALAAHATVVYTQDWHPASTPHFAKDGGIWPVHCVAGTPGAEFVADLTVAGQVVRKGTAQEDGYSGFSEHDLSQLKGEAKNTNLDSLLRNAGVRSLVVVGLAGDYCVKATALDGVALNYAVTVPLSLTRFVALAPGDEEMAISELAAAGVRIEDA